MIAADDAGDPLREAMECIDPDGLSPREALDLVYRLKRIADGD
jgi:DNA mismatch repair protein MutS